MRQYNANMYPYTQTFANIHREARQAAEGGRLPKEVLDTVRKQFWDYVDQQLDEAEQRAIEQMRG